MSVFLQLELPYPVGVNGVWRAVSGRVLLSAKARVFREQVVRLCQLRRVMPVAGPVSVFIRAYRPRLVGDVDAPIKATLDALTHGGAWLDDGQVDHLEVRRLDDKERPRVEVSITGERWATAEEMAGKVPPKKRTKSKLRLSPAFTPGGHS